MGSGGEAWSMKEWVEAASYTVVLLGAFAGAMLILSNHRREAIDQARNALVRTWTNEGDISSRETHFMDLRLTDADGDIIGTLSSPQLDWPLDVNVDVGWRSSIVHVREMRNAAVVEVAVAHVVIDGNQNRLKWEVTSADAPDFIPRSTVLWPSPVEPIGSIAPSPGRQTP
jgi:hypothetical protein